MAGGGPEEVSLLSFLQSSLGMLDIHADTDKNLIKNHKIYSHIPAGDTTNVFILDMLEYHADKIFDWPCRLINRSAVCDFCCRGFQVKKVITVIFQEHSTPVSYIGS